MMKFLLENVHAILFSLGWIGVIIGSVVKNKTAKSAMIGLGVVFIVISILIFSYPCLHRQFIIKHSDFTADLLNQQVFNKQEQKINRDCKQQTYFSQNYNLRKQFQEKKTQFNNKRRQAQPLL